MKKLLKDGVSKDLILFIYSGMKKSQRVVLFIMAFLMIVANVLPRQYNTIYAENEDEIVIDTTESIEMPNYNTTTDEDFDITAIEVQEEIEALRTEDTKTFKRVDGTYEIAYYGTTIHYEEDGVYKDIDNTLSYDDKDSSYENKANKFKIKLPKTIDDHKAIKLSMDDYNIAWTVDIDSVSDISQNATEKLEENIKTLSNINQSVTYYSVFEGVDLQYVIGGDEVKENIIINKYISNFEMTFNYEVKNLDLIENDLGNYVFVNGSGETVFEITNLYMFDNNNEFSKDIKIEVTETKKDTYQIIIKPNDEWLKGSAYPVVIDPSISSVSDITIHHTWVESDMGTHYDENYILFDNGEDAIGLINFTVPSYLEASDVMYANLNLTTFNIQNGGGVCLYELYEYVDLSNVDWVSMPNAYTDISNYVIFTDNETTYSFDITNSLEKWLEMDLDEMPGFKLNTHTDIGQIVVYGSQNSFVPMISIGYMDTQGIKDYWTYNSQDIAQAGTGYISDYTQALYLVRNDFSFSTDLQSLGVNFAFSNEDISNNIGYGYGWNVSYNLKLHLDTIYSDVYMIDYTGNRVDYYLADSDTRIDSQLTDGQHVTCYVADDGSGDKLYHKSDANGYIETILLKQDGTEYRFDETTFNNNEGYMDSISNIYNDLTITIDRNSVDDRLINSVVDTSGNRLVFAYSSGLLSNIVLQTIDNTSTYHTIEKVYYTYNSSYLSTIYYLTDYDLDNDLTLNTNNLINVDQKVYYEYHSVSHFLAKAQVRYIDDSGDESYGEELRYYYYSGTNKITYFMSYFNLYQYSLVYYDNDINQTTITDHSGNYVTYTFDQYGHTVWLIDNDNNMINYQYYDIFSTSVLNGTIGYDYIYNHKVVNTTTPNVSQGFSNYIFTEDFENALSGWTTYTTLYSTISIESESANSVSNHYVEINNTFNYVYGYLEKVVMVGEEGYHTFTVEVKNNSLSSEEVYIDVNGQVRYVPNDNEWHKLSITVFVENINTPIEITLYNGGNGTVQFDNVRLFCTNTQNSLNILGTDFETTIPTEWTVGDYSEATIESNGLLGTDNLSDIIGQNAVQLKGILTRTVEVDFLKSNLGSDINCFNIGAWAKNTSGFSAGNMYFGIQIKQYDTNGNLIETTRDEDGYTTPTNILFDVNDDEWQFIHQTVYIDSACRTIDISLIYDEYIDVIIGQDVDQLLDSFGEVQFDGVGIFPNNKTTTNIYDEYGRISSVLYGDGTSLTYTYPVDTDEYMTIPETVTDREGNVTEYVQFNNQITGIITNNVKVSPVYNTSEQMTAYNVGTENDADAYFSTTTSYVHNNQYLSTSTNEFGQTTTYYTDLVTGLMAYIEKANDVKTQYEYYDDGMLKKVYVDYLDEDDVSATSYIQYIYDEYDRLIEIVLDNGYSYQITYDLRGRMETVKVNNQTLMAYDYVVDYFETNIISSQEYATGDKIYFNYDGNNEYITSISFQASGQSVETRFTYVYDDLGRVVQYDDLIIGSTEYYAYDAYGNLTNITCDNGDSFVYTYDDEGYLVEIICNMGDETVITDYDYEESSVYNDLYDKTGYGLAGTNDRIEMDYNYESSPGIYDPLKRLLSVQYTISGVCPTQFELIYSYTDYTSRIENITYDFANDNLNFRYTYAYDEIGNIIRDQYLVYDNGIYVLQMDVTYVYDDLNQLIAVHSRDYDVVSETTFTDTNYTQYFYYDDKGNITETKKYLYGQTDELIVEVPDAYAYNYGTDPMYVIVGGDTEIDVGDTLNLTFDYYKRNFVMPPEVVDWRITTTCDYASVNTSQEGYYLLECVGKDRLGLTYELHFGIVITVGTPTPGGRIPIEQIVYDYDETWLDQLEGYESIIYDAQGNPTTVHESIISYDAQGNPIDMTNFVYKGTTYHHAVLTWEGRQLIKIEVYSTSGTTNKVAGIVYTYNDQGIRTSKTIDSNGNDILDVNDWLYEYKLSGDVLISESKYIYITGWVENYQIIYTYDYDGSLIGFNYYAGYNTEDYIYAFNVQGDVTKILKSNGTIVVEYTYDAYGNITSISGIQASTIGIYNSMRYRGYKYDEEIGMYYLNSRYYDPEIGRFINADGMLGEVGQLGTTNMYAYCANNPVMYVDPSGESFIAYIILAVIGVIIQLSLAAADDADLTIGIDLSLFMQTADLPVTAPFFHNTKPYSPNIARFGITVVIDYSDEKNEKIEFYPHAGFGYGYGAGPSISVGLIANYDEAGDYSGHFLSTSVGSVIGVEHSFNPIDKYNVAVKSYSITFSTGFNIYFGYDYYFYNKSWTIHF